MRTLSLHHRALIVAGALLTALALGSLILLRGLTPMAGAADTYTGGYSTDLSITGSGPSGVDRGQSFINTYTVRNLGPSVAHRVTVTSELPSGVVFHPAGSTPGCRLMNANTVECDLGILPDSLVRTVTVGLRTPFHDACSDATYQTSATVKSDESDTVAGNNRSATIYTLVRCVPPPKQCSDGLDNDRDNLIDLQDPGCRYASDDFENREQFDSGAISSEERLRLRLLSRQAGARPVSIPTPPFAPPLPPPVVIAPPPMPVPPVSVTAPNLTVRLAESQTEAMPGDALTYVVTVSNPSDQSVQGANVSFRYPSDRLTVTDDHGATGAAGQLMWSISLAPYETRMIPLVAKVNRNVPAGTQIQVSVTVDGPLGTTYAGTTLVVMGVLLPRTGAGDFTRPVEDVTRFLRAL